MEHLMEHNMELFAKRQKFYDTAKPFFGTYSSFKISKIPMKAAFLSAVLLCVGGALKAQNYTSLANGAWTTPANWNNTSGWGPSTPPLTYTSGTITVNHNMTISSAANIAGGGLNLAAGRTITSNANFTFSGGTSNVNGAINVTGNFTVSNGSTNIYGSVSATGNLSVSGGATLNVYGTLDITGSANLNANMVIRPGGKVIVRQSVTVVSSTYLTIGTNVAPPAYADLVVYQNLIQQGSGDVTIRRNGRVAIFGNVTDSGGGGSFIRVENGGQTYVHGNVTYSGGGSAVQNNNTTSPYGLYVNGTTTSSGGGGSVTTNLGDEVTMQNTNLPFYNWVTSQPNNPLPITLLYFKVDGIEDNRIFLSWATSMERDFDYFQLERAGADLKFSTISRIENQGGLEVNTTYHAVDQSPIYGKNYYRLKSVDIDGKYEFSNVIVTEWNGIRAGIGIYPNPTINRSFTIELNDAMVSPVNMSVYESKGYTFYQTVLNSTSTTINLPDNINPGIYFVKLSSPKSQQTFKVVVR